LSCFVVDAKRVKDTFRTLTAYSLEYGTNTSICTACTSAFAP